MGWWMGGSVAVGWLGWWFNGFGWSVTRHLSTPPSHPPPHPHTHPPPPHPHITTHHPTLHQTGDGPRLGVISNFDERLPKLLEALGIADYFDIIITSKVTSRVRVRVRLRVGQV